MQPGDLPAGSVGGGLFRFRPGLAFFLGQRLDVEQHLLLKAREGDVVKLVTPVGAQEIEVLRVEYPKA